MQRVRKKKHVKSAIAKDKNWKTVPLSNTLASKGFLEGLVGLEELTEYDADLSKMSFSIKGEKRLKKRGRKKRKSSITSSDSEEQDEEALPEHRIQVPKKRKINKFKAEDKSDIVSESPNVENEDNDHIMTISGPEGNNSVLGLDEDEEEEIMSTEEKDNTDMSAWNDLFVPPSILKGLKDKGFTAPTAIQALVLPSAIRDKMDIVGAAETGSGKTLAFAIPLLNGILKDKQKKDDKKLKALILTPTRELAIQIRNHIVAAAKYAKIKVAVVVGGLAYEKQNRILKTNPEIVVATPGRLWEMIEEGNAHLGDLSHIRYLVIDETDRMVEKGHFLELTQILELINENEESKKERQTFVFSATLTLTHDLPIRFQFNRKKHKMKATGVEDKLKSMLSFIGVKSQHKLVDITRKLGTAENLTEARINCSSNLEKDYYLYYFLKKYPGRTLVFSNSIDCVRRLNTVMTLLRCSPLPLHASMHQKQRLKNLERFSSNPQGLLLATDVAARGLDIPNVSHVIHYQVPRTSENYIHRSGRTARATREGISIMLIDPTEGVCYRKLIATLNRETELPVFPVEQDVLKAVKKIVDLAREVDRAEYRNRRKTAKNSWFIKAAEEMDMDVDQDLISDDDDYEKAKEKRMVEQKKAQLSKMLKEPLWKRNQRTCYPTKMGEAPSMIHVQEETAMSVIKNEKLQVESILKEMKKKIRAAPKNKPKSFKSRKSKIKDR